MFLIVVLFVNIIPPALAAEEFLCEKFYGGRNVVTKLPSTSQNPPLKLIVLDMTSHGSRITFEKASDICRLCLNATLVVQDDVTQITDYVPTWIGVQSRGYDIPDSTSGWEWVDGSGTLNRWQLNFASSIDVSRVRHDGLRYAILADMADDGQNMLAQAKWIAMATNETTPPYSSTHYSHQRNRHMHKEMKHLICRRPVQNNCQYWNYTEDSCMTNTIFGCHNYVNVIYQPSDNQTINCEVPRHRRLAFKCPCANCTCPVTEWSHWSSCGMEQCSKGKTYRVRSRKESPPCPRDHLHQKLTDREECEVPGCKELLAADADNDTCRTPSSRMTDVQQFGDDYESRTVLQVEENNS